MTRRWLIGPVASLVFVGGCFNPDNPADGDTEAASSSSDGSGTTDNSGATSLASTSVADGSTTNVDSSGGEDIAVCVEDSDCDDGLACNGVETCEGDRCTAGEDPCAPEDPEHCDSVCEEGEDGPVCATIARDADDDDHGDMLCAEAPGDDCNDDDSTVYPGAPELCDSLDNNCNDLTDLDDGLTIFDAPIIVPDIYFVDVAYSEADGAYGIATNGVPGRQFYSYNIDQTLRAITPDFPNEASDRVFLEWGGDGFGAFYRGGPTGPTFMRRQSIDANGVAGAIGGVAASGGVTSNYGAREQAGGGFGVVWGTSTDGVRLRLLDGAFAPSGLEIAAPIPGDARTPRLVRNGDTFALGWQEASTSTRIAFFDSDFNETATAEVTDNPAGPIYGTFGIVPMGDRYGVAFNSGGVTQRVEYIEYESSGTVACGPITLADSSTPYFLNMDAYDGAATIYVAQGDDWILHRVREGCEPIDSGAMMESVTFFGEIGDVDINSSGIGVVSQIFDEGGANPRMSVRMMGPNLCDPPVVE